MDLPKPDPAPVLPWASNANDESKETEPEEQPTFSPCRIEDIGLSNGDRIEVYWKMIPDDGGEPYEKWWGASISGRVEEAEEGDVYEIKYDAAEGYEEEVAQIQFLGDECIKVIGMPEEEAVMNWRREGDEGDEEEDPMDALDSAAADQDVDLPEVVTLGQIKRHFDEVERELGGELDNIEQEAMAKLAPRQREQVRTAFKSMSQNLGEYCQALVAQKGDPNYAISAEDINMFFTQMKTKNSGKHFV